MQHPELSHPKFLLRYFSDLGLERRSDRNTRYRPIGQTSESRQHRRWEYRQLSGNGGKDDKGKGGKGGGGGGKGGKDDKDKDGKGKKGRKE